MKYWNKRKSVRERCWICVKVPLPDYSSTAKGLIVIYYDRIAYLEIKRRLQRLDNPGKFYMDMTNKTVWFERSEDAVWFTLTNNIL